MSSEENAVPEFPFANRELGSAALDGLHSVREIALTAIRKSSYPCPGEDVDDESETKRVDRYLRLWGEFSTQDSELFNAISEQVQTVSYEKLAEAIFDGLECIRNAALAAINEAKNPRLSQVEVEQFEAGCRRGYADLESRLTAILEKNGYRLHWRYQK